MTTKRHTPCGAAFTSLILEVFRLNGALLAAGDELGAATGLTSARWQVLGAIDAGPLPVAHIARRMGLTRQGVQRTVNVLLADGLVQLVDNPDHRRAKLVQLTGDGRERLDRTSARQVAWANEVADGLATAALERTNAQLRQFRVRLERE